MTENHKGDTDRENLSQWDNASAATTRVELQASSPYLPVLAPHLDRIAMVDDMLVWREQINGTNRVIVLPRLWAN